MQEEEKCEEIEHVESDDKDGIVDLFDDDDDDAVDNRRLSEERFREREERRATK